MDDESKTVLDESVLNANLFQLGKTGSHALYKRRIDDQGFAFGSGNARDRYKQLEATVRLNADEYLKQITDKFMLQIQTRKVKEITTPVQPSTYPAKSEQEEEEDLQAPKPDGNKRFLQALRQNKP